MAITNEQHFKPLIVWNKNEWHQFIFWCVLPLIMTKILLGLSKLAQSTSIRHCLHLPYAHALHQKSYFLLFPRVVTGYCNARDLLAKHDWENYDIVCSFIKLVLCSLYWIRVSCSVIHNLQSILIIHIVDWWQSFAF